ncbi:HNH endonuclease [Streptomyces sp. NPDC088768]|uniref:HNH endonuclease n=1 Tax=Streptomyces sp. NPDC088768 TaxID=3365894 RepID=UPI0037FC0FA3
MGGGRACPARAPRRSAVTNHHRQGPKPSRFGALSAFTAPGRSGEIGQSLKTCRLCGRDKPASDFLAGKAKRPSSACAQCRGARAAQHRRRYFASLSPDERHTRTQRKRAADYGVAHVPYSRTEVLARWSHSCCYCGGWATHLDHVIPLSRGGADVESNMVPACERCNLSKGAKSLAEWAATFGPEPPPF